MNAKLKGTALLVAGMVVGLGLAAAFIWNPSDSMWIDHFLGRTHEMGDTTGASEKGLYTCGMHPQVVQEGPGDCPICGMRLMSVGMQAGGGEPSLPAAERKILHWRAPMNPNYVSDKPGKSPMRMDLVPVYEDEAPTEGGIRVSRSFLQNFAVRTTEVQRGSLPMEIRTVGVLAHNEEKVVSVSTKFEGWIEKANFNNVGEPVNKGDVLFEIYSPQLVTTEREYLAAMAYVERLTANGAYPDAIERAKSLLKSARERLRYWDMTEEQIEALEERKEAGRTIRFLSPASGSIVAKMGDSFEGMKLSPGMTILKLAHHATLWAEVEFFEQDIRHVREGQTVSVEVDAYPGRRWSGKILLLRPAMNPKTRTLTALVEVANKDLKLRPQMFANVSLRAGGVSNSILVPDQAVLHSGERAIVVVVKAAGLFEPREVQLGIESNGMQEITQGLSAGETIVTSSQFLIDSESNLKAAISQLLSERAGTGTSGPPMSPAHQH
ncbi:MAG: efflux RND transporter periplasmic adaptor subunit [Acidobacteria bacterium]|nr:efflux RND transporter periplasmic adaptor subunit [Acidobacteriota bacterium]